MTFNEEKICLEIELSMSRINIVQQKVKDLEGGKFQKMYDTYLF
ncbi:hypothetical protein LGAA44_20002 [Leuconostoc gasicomitatum]|nr:hypothetical protein LGAA44_20002 [Leuconostoc gasicomitatum]